MFLPMGFSNYFHTSTCTSHNASITPTNDKVLKNLSKYISASLNLNLKPPPRLLKRTHNRVVVFQSHIIGKVSIRLRP